MSFVTATPERVQGAAQDVAGIGSSLTPASSAAGRPHDGGSGCGAPGTAQPAHAGHARADIGVPQAFSLSVRMPGSNITY
jgi:hypothetical protein